MVRHGRFVLVDIAGPEVRWIWNSGPQQPPCYELRRRFADRWVRFHSLPGSKRYYTNP